MRRPIATAVALAAASAATWAQDVGRDVNFQTPSAPNYRPLVLPKDEPFTLPAVPAPPVEGAAVGEVAKLHVKKIRVDGVTVFTPEQLAAVVAPYEGREVSSSELQSVRVALTRLYVDNGYVSSGVLLPDQKIQDGVVVYRAVEGSLSTVELVGDPKVSSRYVASRVRRHVDDPLNVSEVQYALRYLQQDPNVSRLDARLAPGDAPGQSVLRLSVQDAPRFHAGLSADNHRASSTGAERATVFGGIRNLTGYGEEFRLSTAISEGANEGSAVFSLPLSARNVLLQAYYSLSDADIIEKDFERLDINSETETRGVSLTVPLIEELNTRLALLFGFESVNSETTLAGQGFSFSPGAIDGVTETDPALLGLDWVQRGRNSVTGLRLTYRRGLDILDATIYEPDPADPFCDPALTGGAFDPCNPTGADAEFDLLQGQAVFLQRLNGLGVLKKLSDRAQFVFRTTAQISQDPLLSQEKLAIGGVNTVRGYPENLLVRDNGVAATLELQLPIPGYREDPHPANLVLVPFVDYGRSWDERDTDPGSDIRNTDEARYIASAGLGLLWKPLKGLDVQLYWGGDIADNFEGDDPRDTRDPDLQDDGFHFSVAYVARW